ncbi:MAG: prepilin-type N-terminal cleavage/methylation protein [Alphaproteobacteria bacterium]|nr:prepilin-type N-terminal cleavage/methylation protein [Alphaproteobacteria bacterium]
MNETNSQKGFTLVEMAIVILIMGLVVGSYFSFLSVQQEEKKYQITIQRQKKIAGALSTYAQTYGRLPCPADQNVNESAFGTMRTSCPDNATRKGVVPYMDLGLSLEDISDGYNNPFTYVVSPAASSVSTDTHARCRITTGSKWVISPNTPVNARKAIFCGQQVAESTEIRVYRSTTTADSNLIFNTQTHPPAGKTTPPNGRFNTPQTGVATDPAPNDFLQYIAYLLISHGENGEGSYTLPSGTNKFANTKAFTTNSPAEMQNADTGMNFVYMPRRMVADTTHFDDLMMIRTQDNVVSEFGNDSCAVP